MQLRAALRLRDRAMPRQLPAARTAPPPPLGRVLACRAPAWGARMTPSDRQHEAGGGDAKPLLAVENLKKHFPIHTGVFSRVAGYVYAVDGVSFAIRRGETL